MNKILLSFDVEEFDMPLEYNHSIELDEQLHVGKNGLDEILKVIQTQNIPCTFFATGVFAKAFPNEIKNLSQQHEIASHTYYHSNFKTEHLKESKDILESITQKKITGFRMPRMAAVNVQDLKDAGYQYDSSINPLWLPGRYNNLHKPRTLFIENELIRLPASVTPNLRLPLFWLSFKNMPYSLFLFLVKQTLKKDGYVCLYFHPWEFVNLASYKIPSYTKKNCDTILLNKLNQLITDLKKIAHFTTIQNYIDSHKNFIS